VADWDVVSHAPAADPWAVVSHAPADAPPSDGLLKQIAMAPVGAAEEFLKAGSRAVSAVPAGLAYGGAAIGKAFGADVDPAGVQRKVSDALTYQPISNSGQAADQAFADTYGPVGRAAADQADKVAKAVGKVSPTAEAALREAPAAATAAGALVPAMSTVRAAAGEISAARAAAEANVPDWKKAGLRTADDHPVARNVAGQSGREALTLHNGPVADTVAANEAGSTPGRPMSQASLIEGRKEPNSVFGRVEKALPTGQLDAQAASDIKTAGAPEGGRMSNGSPVAQQQIEALRAQLLDPNRQFTGQQIVNEMRGLRQEGFANAASEDVSNQQLGKAQLDMARAVEGHIGRNLPTTGDVSLEQFQGARKALAKNFTVQAALRGSNVDMQALARAYRADPELLDGGTKMLAQFADAHPEVSSLPSPNTRYNPPGLARDFSDIDLKKPLTYVQPALGAAARRVMTGSPAAAVEQAGAMFPPRSPQAFAPIPPPPPPRIAGLLPSPAMVNAGGGVATPGALDNLGLTPDVQAAAAAHPGAPRLGALHRPPEAPAPMESVEMHGPENWSSVLQTNGAPPVARPSLGGVPLADVLAHGVEQAPPPGLSLALDQNPAPPSGLTFQRNAAHEAGDLGLAPDDSWFSKDHREHMKDLADVMRQGVPDGTMVRTVPGRLANNASGESAASMEAISRGTKPLAIIDPDGNAQPLLRDVTQIDRTAPKGHLIIDTATGEIIDRGGLTQAAANGLRNRWAALKPAGPTPGLTLETPEETRQRLLARALRNNK
jgi:hypothetical protein